MTSAPGHETPAAGPITVINVFEVPAEQVGEFSSSEGLAYGPGSPCATGRARAGALPFSTSGPTAGGSER
jgi:hypothetical protein